MVVFLSLGIGTLEAGHPEQPVGERNLLKNGDLESAGKRVSDWSRGQPVPGVEYLYDATGGVDQSRALSLNKTVERYYPIAGWQQEFGYEGPATRLHVGALVRATRAYKAVIDVEFVSGDETTHKWAVYIGAQESGDPPADHDWRWCSGVVAVPEGTESIRVLLQIYGPGQVWFDRVLARYVSDAMEPTDATRVLPADADQYGALPMESDGDSGRVSAEDGEEEWSRSCEDLRVGDDDKKRYFLMGPPAGKRSSYGLLLIVPGGDGSADFKTFARRIAEHAVVDDMIVAVAVAPVWRPDEDRVVWPTTTHKDPLMGFPTEDLLCDIISDASRVSAKRGHRVDKKRVYTLGWSSGGPPCYALSLRKDTPVRGTFVAMSVFVPANLPPLKAAKGHAYYLLHSPDDFIAMTHPERAAKELGKERASVTLQTYEGGHGWRGDVYAQIRAGIAWMEGQR